VFPLIIEDSTPLKTLHEKTGIEFSPVNLVLVSFYENAASSSELCAGRIRFLQWAELGFVLFPLAYVFFFVRNVFLGMSLTEARLEIPFVKEIWCYRNDEAYTKTRHHYQWLNFV